MPTALEQEIGHGNARLTPWSAFDDVTETVPELAWPNSITTYSAMRTDAQIASLLLPFTLPIRRYRWYIDPNGARDEVVEHIANDFNQYRHHIGPAVSERRGRPTGSTMPDRAEKPIYITPKQDHERSRLI